MLLGIGIGIGMGISMMGESASNGFCSDAEWPMK